MNLYELSLDQLNTLTLDQLFVLPLWEEDSDEDQEQVIDVIDTNKYVNRLNRAIIGTNAFYFKDYGSEITTNTSIPSVRVNEDKTKEEILIGE